MIHGTFVSEIEDKYGNVIASESEIRFMTDRGGMIEVNLPSEMLADQHVVVILERRKERALESAFNDPRHSVAFISGIDFYRTNARIVAILLLRETRSRHDLRSLIRYVSANPGHARVNVLNFDEPPLPHPIEAFRSLIRHHVLRHAWHTTGRGRNKRNVMSTMEEVTTFLDRLISSKEAGDLIAREASDCAILGRPPMPLEFPILIDIAAAEDADDGWPGGILSRMPDALGGMLLLASIRLFIERGITGGWLEHIEQMMERVKEYSEKQMYGRPYNQLKRIHAILSQQA